MGKVGLNLKGGGGKERQMATNNGSGGMDGQRSLELSPSSLATAQSPAFMANLTTLKKRSRAENVFVDRPVPTLTANLPSLFATQHSLVTTPHTANTHERG